MSKPPKDPKKDAPKGGGAGKGPKANRPGTGLGKALHQKPPKWAKPDTKPKPGNGDDKPKPNPKDKH